MLFEIEGTGREIAELERRMRVSDQVLRYLTVRVDEERQRAEKLKARRARKASKRPIGGGRGGRRSGRARRRRRSRGSAKRSSSERGLAGVRRAPSPSGELSRARLRVA